MTVKHYKQQVDLLDKEIADLERKKTEEDKIALFHKSQAPKITLSRFPSTEEIMDSIVHVQNHYIRAYESEEKIMKYSKLIEEKREKREEAYSNWFNALVATSNGDNLEPKEYDVFISHAWEDKESFVDEFVEKLKFYGVNVWYDDVNITWGKSLREEIDKGLRKSGFGIIVLSPSYIDEKKYWTKKELNGLFQLESVNSGVILPIWHQLTKSEVLNYSPIIADRKALTTANFTPDEMAIEFVKLMFKNRKN
ncbi:MAG TPA: toll/interleukin-1 receptor domain-containing protein [Anaerolineaceae bacterium]|nr:toll/interleukin-1 receptor domain-containing protein [Anaerolineaceae bacterium]